MGKEGGIIEHFRSPDFVQYYIVSLYISSNIFIIHVSCVRQSFLADLLVIDVPCSFELIKFLLKIKLLHIY